MRWCAWEEARHFVRTSARGGGLSFSPCVFRAKPNKKASVTVELSSATEAGKMRPFRPGWRRIGRAQNPSRACSLRSCYAPLTEPSPFPGAVIARPEKCWRGAGDRRTAAALPVVAVAPCFCPRGSPGSSGGGRDRRQACPGVRPAAWGPPRPCQPLRRGGGRRFLDPAIEGTRRDHPLTPIVALRPIEPGVI